MVVSPALVGFNRWKFTAASEIHDAAKYWWYFPDG
jgi:hypothetical protein